jgi:ribosomal protein S18 acetylase RimI-like enzyme
MMRKYTFEDRKPLEILLVEMQNEQKKLDTSRANGEVVAGPYLVQILDEVNKNGEIFLAEENGQLVGFITFWIEEDYSNLIVKDKIYGFISDLFVLSEYRNRGIGKELLDKTENYFRAKGLLTIKLYSLASNKEALEFYSNHNFREYELLLTKKLG